MGSLGMIDPHPNLSSLSLFPLVEKSSDAVAVAAPDPWRLVYANATFARWFGGTVEDAVGKPLEAVLGENNAPGVMERLESFWRSDEEDFSVSGVMLVHGRFRPVTLRGCRLLGEGQPLLGILMSVQSEARNHAAPIAPQRRDPLTGLPDRAFLLARLSALLRGDEGADRQFAVLFVDLNNFKRVNDAQGHLVGDRVLREVARRLVQCVRDGDHVVRFGGDEFVVLVEQVAARAEVEPIIGRIHAVLAKPIALPDGEVTLSVSIGAAEASPEHHTAEDILSAADRAMYATKRSNG